MTRSIITVSFTLQEAVVLYELYTIVDEKPSSDLTSEFFRLLASITVTKGLSCCKVHVLRPAEASGHAARRRVGCRGNFD